MVGKRTIRPIDMKHKVIIFRSYPFKVGQKIHIEGGLRRGDWEVVGTGERKIKLRCPISQREFEWDRFCYFVEEKNGVEWPHILKEKKMSKRKYMVRAECPQCACGDVSFLGPEKLREKFIGDEKEIEILCPFCGTKHKGKLQEEIAEED